MTSTIISNSLCSSTNKSSKNLKLSVISLKLSFGINDTNNRKRKKFLTHLSQINLNATSKLSGSTDSLNLNTSVSPSIISDDDCITPPLSSASDDQPLFNPVVLHEDGEKQSRIDNQLLSQSYSTSAIGSKKLYFSNSIQNNVTDDYYDFTELDCSQNILNTKSCQKNFVSSGLIIGENEYELFDYGREYKAVDLRTKIVYHCQGFKLEEYKTFLNVLNRLKLAELMFDQNDYIELKNLLIPDEIRVIPGKNSVNYVLLPDHYGNLHSLVQTRYNNFSSLNSQAMSHIFSERRVQPIFKQIVLLVDFCHKIGIYFRDFRLRKFVFTDQAKTKIRLCNVLGLWVAPEINDDRMTQRHVCPAYVAPEILDVKANVYGGKLADVWALGVLMFILLTGRYPFYEANPNPMALFRRIKTRRFSFPINKYISSSARWLLHGILRLKPSERPSTAEILESHWLRMEPESLPDDFKNILDFEKTNHNLSSQNYGHVNFTNSQPFSTSLSNRHLLVSDFFDFYF